MLTGKWTELNWSNYACIFETRPHWTGFPTTCCSLTELGIEMANWVAECPPFSILLHQFFSDFVSCALFAKMFVLGHMNRIVWQTRFALTDKIAPYPDSGLLRAHSYYSWDDIAPSHPWHKNVSSSSIMYFCSAQGCLWIALVWTGCMSQTCMPIVRAQDIDV